MTRDDAKNLISREVAQRELANLFEDHGGRVFIQPFGFFSVHEFMERRFRFVVSVDYQRPSICIQSPLTHAPLLRFDSFRSPPLTSFGLHYLDVYENRSGLSKTIGGMIDDCQKYHDNV